MSTPLSKSVDPLKLAEIAVPVVEAASTSPGCGLAINAVIETNCVSSRSETVALLELAMPTGPDRAQVALKLVPPPRPLR